MHGNTQNDTCGKNLLDYFYNKGHSVLSYDLPGHGDSELELDCYQFSALIDLNFDVLQKFSIKSPILCGHSLGGMIQAGCIAKYQLKNASLVLCGSYDGNPVSSAHMQSQHKQAKEIDDALNQYIKEGFQIFSMRKKYDYFKNRAISDLETGIINRRFTHPQANANNLTTLGNFNARDQLKKLAIPILALHGEQEDVIPAELVRKMAECYQQIKVCWYPQGGHYAFYQFTELTQSFLDKHYSFITSH